MPNKVQTKIKNITIADESIKSGLSKNQRTD